VLGIGIDGVMNKYYRLLHAYVVFPPLARTENVKAASDVSDASRPEPCTWPQSSSGPSSGSCNIIS
jgi:hypothetical protein